jgi:hypothetical protein
MDVGYNDLEKMAGDNGGCEATIRRPAENLRKEGRLYFAPGLEGVVGRWKSIDDLWRSCQRSVHLRRSPLTYGLLTSESLNKHGQPVAIEACASMTYAPQNTLLRSSKSTQSLAGGMTVGRNLDCPSTRCRPRVWINFTARAVLRPALMKMACRAS